MLVFPFFNGPGPVPWEREGPVSDVSFLLKECVRDTGIKDNHIDMSTYIKIGNTEHKVKYILMKKI